MNVRDRKIAFSYLFSVYLLCGLSETLVSPLFPLIRHELDLVEAQQATLLAAVAAGIAVCNVVGGIVASIRADRSLVRVASGVRPENLQRGLLVEIRAPLKRLDEELVLRQVGEDAELDL